MNPFTSLDLMFPCGAERFSGEVVSLTVLFSDSVDEFSLTWKRKAWYVNASVNAWHLYRGLISEFKSSLIGLRLSSRQQREVNRVICSLVMNAYLANNQTGNQDFRARVHFETDGSFNYDQQFQTFPLFD
jgi:hypothetical protein